jgi:hypothetical protein
MNKERVMLALLSHGISSAFMFVCYVLFFKGKKRLKKKKEKKKKKKKINYCLSH